MTDKHYVKPGPKAICGYRLKRKDHESLRETVAHTTDEVTCKRCLELLAQVKTPLDTWRL